MLSGFNTNFRYRGVLFHVQTEDSGLENPHVISHLFHGGNIMASEKRDYSDLMIDHSGPDLEAAVRKLMEGQHKSMLKQLSRGEHDPTIAARMGPDVFREAGSETESSRPTAAPATAEPTFVETSTAVPWDRARNTDTTGDSTDGSVGAPTPAPSPASRPPSPPSFQSEPSVPSVSDSPIAAEEAAEPPQVGSRLSRVFGEKVVSEKPLDEVVLDYLVENARKRRRSSK